MGGVLHVAYWFPLRYRMKPTSQEYQVDVVSKVTIVISLTPVLPFVSLQTGRGGSAHFY